MVGAARSRYTSEIRSQQMSMRCRITTLNEMGADHMDDVHERERRQRGTMVMLIDGCGVHANANVPPKSKRTARSLYDKNFGRLRLLIDHSISSF